MGSKGEGRVGVKGGLALRHWDVLECEGEPPLMTTVTSLSHLEGKRLFVLTS